MRRKKENNLGITNIIVGYEKNKLVALIWEKKVGNLGITNIIVGNKKKFGNPGITHIIVGYENWCW